MFLTALIALSVAAPSDAKPRDVLINRLEKAKNVYSRQAAILGLAYLKQPDCKDILRRHLDDEDQIIRRHALCGLLLLGEYDDAMKAALIRVTRDKQSALYMDWYSKGFAESSCDLAKPIKDVSTLFADEKKGVQEQALMVCAALGGRNAEIVPALVAILASEKSDGEIDFIQTRACQILATIGEKAKAARPNLEALLMHKRGTLAYAAATALLSQDPTHKKAKDLITNAVGSDCWPTANDAAYSIAYSRQCITALEPREFVRLVRVPEARRIVTFVLGQSKRPSPELKEWLIEGMTDDSLGVRFQSATAFSRLYPDERGKILDCLKLAFVTKNTKPAVDLAWQLAECKSLPGSIVAVAKESYSNASVEAAPALALVVLRANPSDTEAETFFRKRLKEGLGRSEKNKKHENHVAQRFAAEFVGLDSVIGAKFRDAFIELLDSEADFVVVSAVNALRNIDSSKPKTTNP